MKKVGTTKSGVYKPDGFLDIISVETEWYLTVIDKMLILKTILR